MNFHTSIFGKIIIATLALVAVGILGVYVWNASSRTHILGTEVRLSEDDLALQAELIIVGTPVKSKTRTVRDGTAGTLLFTDWTVDIRESLKGAAPDPMVITVPGGERFGQKTVADQFEGLKKGDEYLFYLTFVPESQWWTPLSTTQAVFKKDGSAYADAGNRKQTLETVRQRLQRSVQNTEN